MIWYGYIQYYREVPYICKNRYKEEPVNKTLLCCAYSSDIGSKAQ